MVVDQETVIRFGPYNICNGSNCGLNLDLRGMAQANLDLGVFQDSKFTHGIHTLTLAGYRVFAADAPIRHYGGVAVLW